MDKSFKLGACVPFIPSDPQIIKTLCLQVSEICVDKTKDRLFGCSFHQSFVGLWMVDLNQVCRAAQELFFLWLFKL